MSRRKEIINKLMGNNRKMKKLPNIKKKEQTDPKPKESDVPEQFKKEMASLSKEELIMELFFTKVELMHNKRDLELTTYKLMQLSDGKIGDDKP